MGEWAWAMGQLRSGLGFLCICRFSWVSLERFWNVNFVVGKDGNMVGVGEI